MVGGEEFLADFTFDGLPTSNGYNAIFMAESEAENYLWDFGDGKTSTQTSPMHTYALGSTYTASLTATSGPCEATFTQEVVAFITTIVDAQTTNIQLKKSANNLSINGLQIGQEYSVEIFNALGQIIYHKNIANAADRVDLTLPYTSGVMLIKLFQNGRSLAVLKVL